MRTLEEEVTAFASAQRYGADVAEALGLPRDRVSRMVIKFDPSDAITVTAEIYPTAAQIEAIIALARPARDAVRTEADLESAVRRIARQALAMEPLETGL